MDSIRRHLGRGLLIASVAVALIAPGSAQAAGVSVYKGKLTYTALYGEANVLVASYPGSGAVTLTETGHVGVLPVLIAPGTGCTGFGQQITCSGVSSLAVNSGDGAPDYIDTSAVPLPTHVTTGNGNDRVKTGAGADNINTHDGSDVLDGGLGSDVFTGGPGADDVVTYAGHAASEPVVATLDGIQNDGCAACGENDRIGLDVEGLTGGPGNDTLTGGVGDNTIEGGPGSDVQDGGPGNDSIVARDGEADRLACGAGSDGGSADTSDVVGSDCESVQRATYDGGSAEGTGTGTAPPVAPLTNLVPPRIPAQTATVTASGVALVQIVCPATAGVCKGTVDLVLVNASAGGHARVVAARRSKRVKGLKLGSKTFKAKAGEKPIVHIRLNRRGRRRILRTRHTRCRVVVTTRTADGKVVTTTRNITLRARRTPGRIKKRR
jgi:hypothetical protein